MICNGGLTAVVASPALQEENIELFFAVPAGMFMTDGVWWRTAEDWLGASASAHGGIR